MNFSAIDIIFLALIGLFMIRGYLKGFVSEFLSIAALVLGILAALFFYKNGAEFLRENFWPGLSVVPEAAAFIGLFIIVFFVIKLLEIMLKSIIDGIQLGGADRFIGIIFGLAQGVVVVSLILFIIRVQPLFDSNALLDESLFAHLLLPLITSSPVSMENLPNV